MLQNLHLFNTWFNREMLKLGSSIPWPEAMEKLTGSRSMSTLSLQRYFEPLTAWLKEQNLKNGDIPGWSDTEWRPSKINLLFTFT